MVDDHDFPLNSLVSYLADLLETLSRVSNQGSRMLAGCQRRGNDADNILGRTHLAVKC